MTTAETRPDKPGVDKFLDRVTIALTLALGLTLFVVAYDAIAWVGLHAVHLPSWAAYVLPAVLDIGLAIAAVGAAVARRRGRSRAISYSLLVLLLAASIVCQITHVLAVSTDPALKWVGLVIASVLPAALLLSVETVLQLMGAGDPVRPVKVRRAARRQAAAAEISSPPGPASSGANRVEARVRTRPEAVEAFAAGLHARLEQHPRYHDYVRRAAAGEFSASSLADRYREAEGEEPPVKLSQIKSDVKAVRAAFVAA